MTPKEFKQKMGRARALRKLARESKPSKAPRKSRDPNTWRSVRNPDFGSPTTLVLPSLGIRIRGPIEKPTLSRPVADALRRQQVERLAVEAVREAADMTRRKTEEVEGSVDTEGVSEGAGAVGSEELRGSS